VSFRCCYVIKLEKTDKNQKCNMHMFLKTILPKINKIRLCSAPKLPHFWDTVYITDCVLTFEWQQCACCDCIRVLFAHFITQLDARIV